MKKLLLAFLFASTNVLAQTAAVPGANAFERFLNTPITKDTVTNGAKRVIEVEAINKGRLTLGIGGSLMLGGMGYSIYEIKEHPEKIEYLLESHPLFIPTLEKYIGQYEWGEQYLDNIAVGEKYWTVQSDLENTQDWKDALKAVKVQIVAEAYKRDSDMSCKNPNYAKEVWKAMASSPDDFLKSPYTAKARSYEINKNNSQKTDDGVILLDVNSYYLLDKYSEDGDNLENDHIPAKAQFKKFIERKLGQSNISEPKNIEKNGTAMTVLIDMHKFGRTRGGKNQMSKINADSLDLKTATIKDLTNHFLFIQNTYGITSQEMIDFMESAIMLWNRNKSLCLYQ